MTRPGACPRSAAHEGKRDSVSYCVECIAEDQTLGALFREARERFELPQLVATESRAQLDGFDLVLTVRRSKAAGAKRPEARAAPDFDAGLYR